MKFKHQHQFLDRKNESARVLQKYPDRRPIICEKQENSKLDEIDKKKYLVPSDLTLQQFIYVVRKRLRLNAEVAIFLFVNSKIKPGTSTINQIYETDADPDGFLYFTYASENVFG